MAQDFIQVSEEQQAHELVLRLPEMLDPVEIDHLNESMLGALEGKADGAWVMDLQQVSYMGSAMLGLIVNFRQQIKQSQGRLILCGLSDRLMGIIRATSLERLFTIVKSRQDAIRQAR